MRWLPISHKSDEKKKKRRAGEPWNIRCRRRYNITIGISLSLYIYIIPIELCCFLSLSLIQILSCFGELPAKREGRQKKNHFLSSWCYYIEYIFRFMYNSKSDMRFLCARCALCYIYSLPSLFPLLDIQKERLSSSFMWVYLLPFSFLLILSRHSIYLHIRLLHFVSQSISFR